MLDKLRSRHPVDLPAGRWGTKRMILVILGGIAAFFVLAPLGLSILGGLTEGGRLNKGAVISIGAGVGFLLVVLVVGGIRGKPGWER